MSSLSTSSTPTSAQSFQSLFDDNNCPAINESESIHNFRIESTAFDSMFPLDDHNDDNNYNIVTDSNATRIIKRRRLNIHNYQSETQSPPSLLLPAPSWQSQHDSDGSTVNHFISNNSSTFQNSMFPNGNFDFQFDHKISNNNCLDSNNISNRFGFQYVLRAATSESVKATDDPLTYLNQGQNYEIKFYRFGDFGQFCGRTFKNIIRLSFYEKRLRPFEKLRFQCWQRTRQNDRILEVDASLSHGLTKIEQVSEQSNIVECTWDGTQNGNDPVLFIRVNCISTEFTARKSGGEKGVPFRLQIETFAANERIGSTAGCQIKVFKMKGADRKQKQDREKFLKRTLEDRQRFQKSSDSTIFIETNNDDNYHAIDYRNSDEGDLQPIVSSTKLSPETVNRIENELGILDRNCSQVLQNWLQINRFRTVSEYFVNFTLTDMFGLSRHDFIDLCGKFEGIRLFNTLRKRPKRIVLTIFIEKSNKLYEPIYLETLQVSEFRRKLLQMIAYVNDAHTFTELFVLGPKNIKVCITDDMLAHLPNESIFDVSVVDTIVFLKQV